VWQHRQSLKNITMSGQQRIETKMGKNLRENQAGLVEIPTQHT